MSSISPTTADRESAGAGKPRRLGKRLLVAMVLAFFLYGGQIGSWTNLTNRCLRIWEFTDGLAVILGITLLGCLMTACVVLLDVLRLDRLKEVAKLLFLVLLTTGVAGTLVFGLGLAVDQTDHASVFWLCWIGFAVLLYRGRKDLTRYAQGFCLILSPVIAICFVQILTWQSWQNDHGTLRPSGTVIPVSARPDADRALPVFLFIFDEWSYDRSTSGDELLPLFENLRGLCSRSTVFTNARSPAEHTKFSIPGLIYQAEGGLWPHNGYFTWEQDGRSRPSQEVPSLFRLAQDHGYRTAVIGCLLPYGRMLGDQLDYCRSYPHDPKGEALPRKTIETAIYNLQFWLDPASEWAWRKTYSHVFSRHWVALNHRFRDETLELIRTCPNNTFAMIHWPIPHPPFVLNADGTYHGPFTGDRIDGTPEDYRRHLGYLDRLIGQVIDGLKASGKFERSMLILTSDHAWRTDPAHATDDSDWKLRVPLIIKMPGQTEPSRVDEPFTTTQLRPLVEPVLQGRVELQEAVYFAVGQNQVPAE